MEKTEEFKEKLFALLREYDVKMIVELSPGSFDIEGINFYSNKTNVDLHVGAWCDGVEDES
jgi:hypothetical protein